MKRIITISLGLLLAAGFAGTASAQKPLWTEYAWRTANRPDADYFVSFISGVSKADDDPKEILDKYEEQARAGLIQQIQVNIEATTDLMIANMDQKSTEAFKTRSVSLSKADIAGLRTERYHDKKKQEAYAIAWVKKSELIYYYRNSVDNLIGKIDNKITEAENYQQKGDKGQALKSYYETMPSFTQLEEAQFILIALGLKTENELRFDRGNGLMLKVKNGITALQQSPRANIDELSYFMAYGLFLQLGDLREPITLNPLTFESSGLKSEFSNRFNEALSRSLVKAGNYQVIAGSKTGASTAVVADGTYWKEGELLKANAVVRRNSSALAAAEVSLPLSWIRENKINWVPENFVKINQLKQIKIVALNDGHEGRAGRPLTKALSVKVTLDGAPLANAPVSYMLDGTEVGHATTNAQGVADGLLKELSASRQTLVVMARLDVAAYASLEPGSAFLRQVESTWPVTPARFLIKVAPLTVCVISSEKMHYNNPLDVNILEPVLKDVLAAKGFAFTDDQAKADLMVNIVAKARNGSNMQGIYFSFVDATVSVIDMASGRETFKKSISSIKGGGADFERAAIKAYEETAKEIKNSIPDKIN